MKKRNLQRIFAAFMATAMVVGVTACDNTSSEEKPTDAPATTDAPVDKPTDAPVDKPTDAPVVTEPVVTEVPVPADLQDLGGMEIIIRDWWSPEDPGEPKTEYEEAQRNYQKEMMDKKF